MKVFRVVLHHLPSDTRWYGRSTEMDPTAFEEAIGFATRTTSRMTNLEFVDAEGKQHFLGEKVVRECIVTIEHTEH